MRRAKAINRIIMALQLAPMTTAQVARCLSLATHYVSRMISLLILSGNVKMISRIYVNRHWIKVYGIA